MELRSGNSLRPSAASCLLASDTQASLFHLQMAGFGSGHFHSPRPLIETMPRVTLAPLAGSQAREVALRIDGIEQRVQLVRQPRHFGEQAFFACPQCSAPRVHLYVFGGELACRKCHSRSCGLTYACRTGCDRAVIRAAKLRRWLGAAPGLLSPLPPRPRHNTAAARYDRLVRELAVVEAVICGKLRATVAQVQRRLK